MYIKKILFAIAIIGIIGLSIFSYIVYSMIFSENTSFEEKWRIHPRAIKGYVSNVKAGRFVLRKGMSNDDLVNTLRSQNNPIKLRFNNQERIENLAGRVASQIEADSLSLLNAFKDKEFLKLNDFTEENALGMYIPNQYQVFWNTSAIDFRDRMLKEYKKFWTAERLKKAKAINLTPNQVMVVASIVQKETAKVDERARVAGVYMNRYKNGWKLDADPTVIYAVKKSKNDWDTVIKRVLYKDLEVVSPYNTYRNRELPPGPIAMPDISSIDAVLNYEKHDYYFFVANVQNFGYHKFAKTLSQHNRNKQEYVRWINKQGVNR